MSSVRIAPSLLSSDFARLAEAIAMIEEGGAEIVHLDVMDGHFVPNLTIGPPVVKALRKETDLRFDTHLMVSDPQAWIPGFLDAGADMISIHVEADRHLHRGLSMIRDGGAKAGVAINPGTAVESVSEVLELTDYLLIMTVNPGFGGQRFIERGVAKIGRAKSMIESAGVACDIEVDGGIDVTTAPRVVAAGAGILVAGSAIFGTSDPVGAVRALRQAAAGPVA